MASTRAGLAQDIVKASPDLQHSLLAMSHGRSLSICLAAGAGVNRHFDIFPAAGAGVLSRVGLEMLAILKVDRYVPEGTVTLVTTWQRAIPT